MGNIFITILMIISFIVNLFAIGFAIWVIYTNIKNKKKVK